MSTPLDDRLTLAAARSGPLDSLALRALRKAVHLLGLVVAHRLQELRASHDPVLEAQSQIEEQSALLGLYQEMIELLGLRWDKVPDKKRPHYTPSQRFRILRVKLLLGLSAEDTAHLFRVSAGTVARWQAEVAGHPERETVGSTVRPTPPLRRYADVVAHTLQNMALLGFEGYGTIAQVLARQGWRIGKTTVARHLKRPRRVPPAPTDDSKPVKPRILRAKYVGHIWMMDFTQVRALFGLRELTVAVVLDVFSRFPLAVRVFETLPTAEDTVALLEATLRKHGRPRHFVSDRGAQLTASLFREILDAHGIKQRFGAIGKHGSIAIIERFIKTMKQALALPLWQPLRLEDLERRLGPVLEHYSFHRPHTTLKGATPAEVYFGLTPACHDAQHPPRGQPGEGSRIMPFQVTYLDDGHRLPVLEKIAA